MVLCCIAAAGVGTIVLAQREGYDVKGLHEEH